jgi:hypothetical protein
MSRSKVLGTWATPKTFSCADLARILRSERGRTDAHIYEERICRSSSGDS